MSIAIAIVLVFCLLITYIIWDKKKEAISLRKGPWGGWEGAPRRTYREERKRGK